MQRDYPQIDLRDTAAGRVPYIRGTRFAVYWLVEIISGGVSLDAFAAEYSLPIDDVRAALAYAEAYPKRIQSDVEHARANREWLERQRHASGAVQQTT